MKSAMYHAIKKILLLVLLVTGSCSPKKEVAPARNETPVITASIIESEYGGYGYDILVNGVITIHQPAIPAVSDNKGFTTMSCIRFKIREREISPMAC